MMTHIGKILAALAGAAALGVTVAPIAGAEDTEFHHFGNAAELVNGAVVQQWTVKELKPSADAIPYAVAGTLWEATATDVAVEGSVIPIVSNFNARARSGQTYRVLFGVATPQGVNPSVLARGQVTTGKVYFDVTGDVPDSVVYRAGGPDLAVWVQPPPASVRSAPRSRSGAGVASESGAGSSVETGAEAEGASVEAGAAESAVGVPEDVLAAEGSVAEPSVQGGSQGTPLDEGSQGTPVAPVDGQAGEPTVAAAPSEADAQPARAGSGAVVGPSAGTPLPADGHGTSATVPLPGA